jgi:hypothetical protein
LKILKIIFTFFIFIFLGFSLGQIANVSFVSAGFFLVSFISFLHWATSVENRLNNLNLDRKQKE